jgi:nucleoid DNA-binding protein
MRVAKMNRLSKKVAKRVNLKYTEVDAILKVTAYELVEVLKKSQRMYWDGLGVFYVSITDSGLSIRIRLSDNVFERLNDDKGERSDEIIFE